ncbi:MAG: spinster family MFS transporter [Woeseiaceae bacterium]
MADSDAVTAEAESGTGSTVYAWYVVFVLMLAQVFSFIDRMIMGLLVGPIRSTFNISDTQYSLLAGFAFALFYGIMGLPLARIADSKSRRGLIAAGVVVWSVMTATCGLAKGFWTLFLARVGVGVGEATLSPAAYSIITDYFPKRVLATALSVFTIGITVGSGLAYMIGGKVIGYVESLEQLTLPVLGDVHGWQLTFFLVGLPGLFVAALMITVREPVRRGLANQEAGNKGLPVAEVVAFFKKNFRALGSHILGVSFFIIPVFGLNIWGPTYLIRTFDYTRADAGWSFGLIMMFAGTIGLLTGGRLADRYLARGYYDAYSRVILGSILCMMPFTVSLGFVQTPGAALTVLFIATFFSAFQGGISAGTLQLMTPNEIRGQAAAVYFLTANLIGFGLGPTIVASFTDFVFENDAAIGQSLALTAGIMCPLAAMTLLFGLKSVRQMIEDRQTVGSNP